MSELATYWEGRYASGSDSGPGSRGATAAAKADYVNRVVAEYEVRSLVDWGCGDGAQAAQLDVEHYLGVDLSTTAIARCLANLPERQFLRLDPTTSVQVSIVAEMALSMDVMFHLVTDDDFHAYLDRLFDSATRVVVVYSTDYDAPAVGHMHRREFTPTVAARFPDWRLAAHTIPATADPEEACFYVYERN